MKALIGRLALHLLVFSIPFLLGLGAAIWVMSLRTDAPEARTFDLDEMPAAPVFDPSLPTAVVLVSPSGTESTDLLLPYGILAESGTMNVLTVGPARSLSPVWHGVDILPHVSFEELDSLLGRGPELIVVPNIANAEALGVIEWVRDHVGDATWLVSVGEGARLLAEAGLLNRRRATSHFEVLDQLEAEYPLVEWVRGVRWVEDASVITAAGPTASIDAALRAVALISGENVAEATADALGYDRQRHPREVEAFNSRAVDFVALYLTSGFVWDKRDIGVALFDGVGEVALGAVFDLYPRVLDADVLSVGLTRRVYTTKHGLQLVPWLGLDTDPKIHELIVPGSPLDKDLDGFREWAAAEEVPAFNPFGGRAASRFVYDAVLEGIAAARSVAVARSVARTVQYPIDQLMIDAAPSWPYDVMVVPFIFGLLALFIFRLARKRRIPCDGGIFSGSFIGVRGL